MLRRRALLGGVAGALAAPTIVRAASLDGLLYPGAGRLQQLPQRPFVLGQQAPGLVGLWPLAGNARDYSTVGANGSLVGSPATVMASWGPTLSFGAGNYITLGSYTALNGATAFTIAAWVIKPAGNFANHSGIIGLGPSAGPRAPWIWGVSGTQTIQAQINSGGVSRASTTSVAIPAGVPVLVMVTWDGTTLTIYINGAVSGTPGSSSIATMPGNSTPNYIGYIDTYAQWPGQIGPTFILTRCLSAAEGTALYVAALAMFRGAASRPYSAPMRAAANGPPVSSFVQ